MLLKNFWYVLAESSTVGSSPMKVRALGQDLVVFRRSSDWRVVVLSDLCVHRMASLAGGQVDGDCVRCPYHGWTYGEDGACTFIPANPPGTPVSRKARVDSYPAEERYGWVWGFLGDLPPAERPPIPPFPEFGEPGWRAVRGEFRWKANYTRVVENAVDVAHTPFVHKNSFGNPDNPVMPEYDVQVGEHSLEMCVQLESPKPKGISRLVMRGGRNRVALATYMPSLNRIDGTFGNGWRTILLLSNLPVDEEHTLSRFIQLRNFFRHPLADGYARKFSMQILLEDQPTVEWQNPSTVPSSPAAELSTKSDALSLEYRKLLKKYADLGWQIDQQKVRKAYTEEHRPVVIPSPLRRSPELSSAWVLDEVPVVTRAPNSPSAPTGGEGGSTVGGNAGAGRRGTAG